MQQGECPIWGVGCEFSTYRHGSDIIFRVENSFRAGGRYELTWEARDSAEGLSEEYKARLTSFLVERRIKGVNVPRLTPADVLRARETQPLPVHERAERLLIFLVRSSSNKIGQFLHIGESNPELFQLALAWSESTNSVELHFLSDYLERLGLIERRPFAGYMFGAKIEVPGYRYVQEVETNPDSSQCFVAMSFDPSMNEVYENGIRPGIEDAGYSPLRIDQEDYVGKVDDKIISEIRRSRFIVADFTHKKPDIIDGNCHETEEGHRRLGARGGVYYEAGFAEGIGLTVIPTCRSDMVNELHFDTRQLNHIVWNNPEDLRERLENRILRVIGEGPNSRKL